MTGDFPTLEAWLRHYARTTPTKLAVAHGERSLTYAELDRQVDQCSALQLLRGVRPGDRVAFCGAPRIAFWTSLLAAARIGAIWLGINPRNQLPEVRHILGDAGPKLLFVESDSATLGSPQLLREALLGSIDVIAVSGRDPAGEPWLEVALTQRSSDAIQLAESHVTHRQAAVIVYTSGSTGKPKGAVLSHAGLSWGAQLQTRRLAVDDPRIVCNLPINHVGCIADVCATTLVKGGFIRFQDKFEPELWFDAIERDRLTIWAGVPTMFIQALALPGLHPTRSASLQLILWGGSAMPRALIPQLRRYAPHLKTAYGLTETACHVAFTDDGASDATLAETVGVPVPEIPIRIAADSPNQAGEIQIGGELNLLEYWRNPQATAAAFTADGWLRTGDIGEWTADAQLRLVGRLHDQFKSGGYNVYPREIEAALETHPAVAQAAVIGVPDAQFQEVGCGFVQLKPSQTAAAAQLTDYLRTRLANYKIPKQLRFVEQLPLLPIGKVDKQQLRALLVSSVTSDEREASR